MKTLWSILSGSNQPASLDVVGPFVEKAKDVLISGLQYYEAKVEESTATTFPAILSNILNLKADQTNRLIENYKENEYRSTPEQFENLVKNKHLHSALLAELWQFYQNERLYLLHCMEFLIKKAHNDVHTYSAIFCGFLEVYDKNSELKKSLLAQLKTLSKSTPPQSAGLITPAMVKMWWNSHARETLLILQCLLHYTNIHSLNAEDLLEILSTCGSLSVDVEETFQSVYHMQTALLVKIVQSKDK